MSPARHWTLLALGAASTAAAGCGTRYGFLDPGGAGADALSGPTWFLTVLMVTIVLVMAVLVLVGVSGRRRGRLDEHLPHDAGGGTRWILLGGVLVPGVVAVGLFALTVTLLRGTPSAGRDADLEVNVTAHQWWWEIEYRDRDLQRRFRTANELHIPVGARVRVNLRSHDVIHSFWSPRLHGKVDAIPGHATALMLRATRAGEYWGECAEYCGVQHAKMRFLIIAEPERDYQAWAARQLEPARVPDTPELARGRAAFEEHACAMCHRIGGTRARGQVAPDLTHFGSRRTIAAGILPNTRARLQAWIVNAQALKPGSRMPALPQFDGPTLNALATYLESLK